MKINDFIAGKLVQEYEYKSFEPHKINISWEIDDPELNMLLSKANLKMGELNAYSELIPDIDFFIKMHVTKEGTQSSRIEGTKTNIDEAIQKEAFIDPEKKDDWQEVQNYITAMNIAIASLQKLPISTRLIQQAHKTLLQGVRGKSKEPGEFRYSQNWIGGASLADAVFIPPNYHSIGTLMSDLENFLNNHETPIPHLIKIGIAHYQFETIHPFLDGNGRIGRLLITLYLVSNQILNKPTLYLSDYFERYKSLYYDNLSRVRTHDDLTQWLKFFLAGILETAENSIQTFKNIIVLKQKYEHQIIGLGKRALIARSCLNYLYGHPITDAKDIAKNLQINSSTAMRLIDDFIKLDILIETTGFKRNRIFSFEEYLALFR